MSNSISDKKVTENPARLIDWLLTPVFLLMFFLILCVFDVLYRISIYWPKWLDYDKVFSAFNHLILFNLKLVAFTKYEVKGSFAEVALPVVVVSNHQSMFDIPFLCVALCRLRLRFVAKTELAAKIPGISIALRNGEHALIDRADPDQAMPELERTAKLSKQEGFALVVFPEGTRSRNGNLRQFKSGGVAKIVEILGEAILLPVVIKGSWRIARFSFKPVSVGNKVEVILTEGFKVSAGEDADVYLARAREQIGVAMGLEGAFSKVGQPSSSSA